MNFRWGIRGLTIAAAWALLILDVGGLAQQPSAKVVPRDVAAGQPSHANSLNAHRDTSSSSAQRNMTDQSQANATFSETQLVDMLQGSAVDKQKTATTYILEHPDAVSPFDYAYVVRTLWQQEGNKSQATFWFYIFQSRTRAWADADTRGDGAAALRASLNDQFGRLVNGWVASDLDAWHDIASRAISYEKKIPLYSGKPDDISNGNWQKLVADRRADYESEFNKGFSDLLADKKRYETRRTANGLYVGPLQSPGEPLPISWR